MSKVAKKASLVPGDSETRTSRKRTHQPGEKDKHMDLRQELFRQEEQNPELAISTVLQN